MVAVQFKILSQRYLEWLRKTTENLMRAGLRVEIWTWDLPMLVSIIVKGSFLCTVCKIAINFVVADFKVIFWQVWPSSKSRKMSEMPISTLKRANATALLLMFQSVTNEIWKEIPVSNLCCIKHASVDYHISSQNSSWYGGSVCIGVI